MDKCETCPKFQEQVKKILIQDDSVMDAVQDIKDFKKECKKVCTKN